jgi:hypothetical protein
MDFQVTGGQSAVGFLKIQCSLNYFENNLPVFGKVAQNFVQQALEFSVFLVKFKISNCEEAIHVRVFICMRRQLTRRSFRKLIRIEMGIQVEVGRPSGSRSSLGHSQCRNCEKEVGS